MPADRDMKILFEDGDGIEAVNIETRDEFGQVSEEASLIGAYWHAVADFLAGNESEGMSLHDFDGMEIDGRFVLTDEDLIEELAAEGELDFDDIYEDQ